MDIDTCFQWLWSTDGGRISSSVLFQIDVNSALIYGLRKFKIIQRDKEQHENEGHDT
ncbi:hypothetical protein SOVF_163770 [Spinacia oleracea]|nr:hypothetical protein SOVF_163770 [Spinacia oleracea]